jgi:hypothetical protein
MIIYAKVWAPRWCKASRKWGYRCKKDDSHDKENRPPVSSEEHDLPLEHQIVISISRFCYKRRTSKSVSSRTAYNGCLFEQIAQSILKLHLYLIYRATIYRATIYRATIYRATVYCAPVDSIT